MAGDVSARGEKPAMGAWDMVKWSEKEKAIQALENKGKVDPDDLIAAARAKEHPCHGDFTWDVKQAAAERWREQARSLIRRCSFLVQVEDVGERVVSYVPSPKSEEKTFANLRKERSTTKVSHILRAEIEMLHGLASRVYGIALAKSGMVDGGLVASLGAIRDQLAVLKGSFGGPG